MRNRGGTVTGLPPYGLLDALPVSVVERARWWEGHILEVLHGLRPEAGLGSVPRPEFDPTHHSLAAREAAKATELRAAGRKVSARTIKDTREHRRISPTLSAPSAR
jgi:hypothetical protein